MVNLPLSYSYHRTSFKAYDVEFLKYDYKTLIVIIWLVLTHVAFPFSGRLERTLRVRKRVRNV